MGEVEYERPMVLIGALGPQSRLRIRCPARSSIRGIYWRETTCGTYDA